MHVLNSRRATGRHGRGLATTDSAHRNRPIMNPMTEREDDPQHDHPPYSSPSVSSSHGRPSRKADRLQAELQPVVARLTERLHAFSEEAARAEQLQSRLDQQELVPPPAAHQHHHHHDTRVLRV